MQGRDLDDLLTELGQKEEKDKFDYEGYAVLDNMKLTRKELKEAVDLMYDIVMTMDSTTREQQYLFGKGLIASKDIFMRQKEKVKSLSPADKETFELKADIFRKRLERVRPLVSFLIKIKEVLK